MVLQVRKEAIASPKTEAKGKALKGKKGLKGVHSTTKSPPVTHIPAGKTPRLSRQPESKSHHGQQEEAQQPLFHHQTPLSMESGVKIKDNCSTCSLDTSRPINTRSNTQWQSSMNLTGQGQLPDWFWWGDWCSKEKYVQSTPDYDAADVTTKIGIM